MKVIIAGSRSITDPFFVWEAAIHSGFDITELVSGCAAGVDALGERLAQMWAVPITRMPAKWEKYGRKAGIVRNMQMGWYADALVAVWDGKSSGTAHMIHFMERLGKPVYVYHVGAEEAGAVAPEAEDGEVNENG